MRRFRLAVLVMLPIGVVSCRRLAPGPKKLAERRAALRAVPGFWQPCLQADYPVLRREDIGQASIVLAGTRAEHAALYDRAADRWQAHRIPEGVRIVADHPHVWWLGGEGQDHYWNTAAGQASAFPHIPRDLYTRKRLLLPDQGMHPWGRVVAGRFWCWDPRASAYRVLDPARGAWQDIPGSAELPQGRAVLDAAESESSVRLSLGPRTYCTMAPPAEQYQTFGYDNARGQWSLLADIPPVYWRRRVPARGGWWVLQDGQGQWLPPGARAPEPGGPWYGLAATGGRLFGWASGCIVEVTDVNPVTREPVPLLRPHASLRGVFAFDGTYLWSWGCTTGRHLGRARGPAVLRHTPGKLLVKPYRVVRGLTGPAFGLSFTSGAIWVPNVGRYDKGQQAWTEMIWRGAPVPDDAEPVEYAVGEDESFLLLGRPRRVAGPPLYVGIAHYDPETNTATRYRAEQIATGQWPFGGVLLSRELGSADAWTLHKQVHGAWVKLRQERGLAGLDLSRPDTEWYLVAGGHAAVYRERGTERWRPIGPPVAEHMRRYRAVRGGREVWFNWYDSRRKGRHGVHEPVGSAILDLTERTLTALTTQDLAPFGVAITPLAVDPPALWGRYYDRDSPSRSGSGKGACFVVAKDRRAGTWYRVLYLDEQLWFDGDDVYANVLGTLRRAARADLLHSIRHGVGAERAPLPQTAPHASR